MDNIPDTIYFKDTECRFTRINRAQARVLELADPLEAIGKTDLDFQRKELAEGFLAEEKIILETGEPLLDRVEYNPLPDGAPRWFSATKVPLKNKEGKITGLVGVSRDITDRERFEEELRHKKEYLEALHQITLDLLNRRNLDEVLQGIVDRAAELLAAPYSDITLWDGQALIVRATTDTAYAQIGEIVHPNEGMAWQVYTSKQPMVVNDYLQWPGHRLLLEPLKLRAVAVMPIMAGQICVGELSLARLKPDHPFTAEQIDILSMFAELASLVLDNTQLITAAMRQSQELSLLHEVRTALSRELDLARIVTRTVEAIAETFGYTLVSLYLLDGDMLMLQHQVGYENVISRISLDEGVSGRVIRTGQAVLLEDVHSDPSFLGAIEGILSEVTVPIFDNGKPVGILNIESRHGVRLTKADLHLMRALSDQISIAIGRARVYSALRRNNERLSVMHEIALELLNQRHLDELPQTITDQIVRLLEADMGYLALREGDELVDRAVTPPDLPYQKTRLAAPDDHSTVWQVYKSREPFVTADYSALPNIHPHMAALGVKAAVLLPIEYGKDCQGVLGTARFRPAYPFDEDDISFGKLFSKLVGVALDNAQLHETLRQESIRDPLTGLFNRRFMQEALTRELHRVERGAQPLAVVMLDLDHFKNINDRHGHDAGDETLQRLGLLLRLQIRGSDIACRYGGEEFVFILPEASLNNTIRRMEQLRQDIKQLAIRHQAKLITGLSGSFGIAAYPQHGSTGEQLLKAADEALYRAKQAGRDCIMTA
jgi:diguanylate cyclase (GGDEF)-like protein/PAS domain S-box-containing protein